MPQSLSNILVHIVFSTKDRVPYLRDPTLRLEMHAIIGGTSKSMKCHPIMSKTTSTSWHNRHEQFHYPIG